MLTGWGFAPGPLVTLRVCLSHGCKTLPCSLGHLTDSASFQFWVNPTVYKPPVWSQTCPCTMCAVVPTATGHPHLDLPLCVVCSLCLLAETVACTVSIFNLAGGHCRSVLVTTRVTRGCKVCAVAPKACSPTGKSILLRGCCYCHCQTQQQPGAQAAFQSEVM